MARHVVSGALTVSLVLLALGIGSPLASGGEVASARKLVEDSGIQGGLVVHLGGGSAARTAALRVNERYLVQGLERDAARVAEARAFLRERQALGPVTVSSWDGKRLPYADNLVNLLIVESPAALAVDEMLRVLAPRGVACVRAGGGWEKHAKPWPKDIDEWTHFLHGPDNNAVARDRVAGPPKRLQWLGGPLWARSHEYDSSLCAMVSAHGRVFYIFDEGPTGIVDRRIPDRWRLVARDAFNGVVLWKRDVPNWGWTAWKRAALEGADWRRVRSQRHRLPLAVPRRLVAAGERVYVTLGYRAPLTALDAATGETLTTYADTKGADEIVHEGGLLVLRLQATPERPGRLVALDAGTGRRLWEREAAVVVPLSLAVSGRRMWFHDRDAVVCLDARSGKPLWRTPTARAGHAIWSTDTTLVVHDAVVLCAGRKQVVGLSAANGTVRWRLPGARGYGAANPPDLFVADGVVWYGRGRPDVASIVGYDPLTGKPARTVSLGGVITRGHHARCYRSKATDDYLLLPKRAVEFVSLKGQPHSRHNWVRGACRYGLLPCNGLLYSTPHPCFCYAGVKLGGFLALAPAREGRGSGVEGRGEEASRLEKGPAFGALDTRTSNLDTSADWPMYRHDPKRSGSTPTAVDPAARAVWQRRLGGRLTQPVVVGRRLFVARVDAGQLCCLDAGTGQPLWDRIVGGRIDSAPTHHQGRLLFGCADGWVYCVRASDGALAWRFRAAPAERRVMAFGRVESAWPVHGSVLVMGGIAYLSAGRSSFLDGGLFLYGLDPVTGKTLCETRLDGPHPDVSQLDEMAYAMEGAKSDILVSDGTLIYLFHNAFDAGLNQQPTPVKGKPSVRNLGVRDFGEHLFSNAGFLDDSWFNRSYWMYGDRWPAFNFAHQSPKAGQLVVFDADHTYAVKCFVRRNMLSPQFFPATDGYYLVADGNANRPVLVASDGKGGPAHLRWLPQAGKLQTCWNLGVGFARAQPPTWVQTLPVRIRAMVRTGNALFAAGTPDVCDPDDPVGSLEGRKGAVLLAIDTGDGKTLARQELEAPPAFDGLIAAAGRLFLSTTDGRVLCFDKARR